MMQGSVVLWLVGCASDPPETPGVEPSTDGPVVDTSLPTDTQDPAPIDTGTPPAPFVATFATELSPGFVFRSNLPSAVDACLGLAGAPCEDADGDGLVDLWEDAVLDRIRPEIEFDESEPRITDGTAVLAMVGRVAPVADRIHVYVMIGYDLDYGRCGLSGHDGDSERVAVALAPIVGAGPGDVSIVAAYTAAHENTVNDHGRVYAGAALAELSFPLSPTDGMPRWRVFASDGKHATYGTLDHCESTSFVPCVEEDCGAEGDDPALFVQLPPVWNAGEPDRPRVTDLGGIGFPDEQAWVAQDFCGGRGRGLLCAGPIVEKLTIDPF